MGEPRRWTVLVTRRAERELRNLPANVRDRVNAAIDGLETYRGDIQKLTGEEDTWRLRVGSYRILFERNQDTGSIVVYQVVHRREAYR